MIDVVWNHRWREDAASDRRHVSLSAHEQIRRLGPYIIVDKLASHQSRQLSASTFCSMIGNSWLHLLTVSLISRAIISRVSHC